MNATLGMMPYVLLRCSFVYPKDLYLYLSCMTGGHGKAADYQFGRKASVDKPITNNFVVSVHFKLGQV